MLRQQDHVTHASNGVTEKFFHTYDQEFGWIEKYISRYKRMPSKEAFKERFPKFRIKAVDDVEHFVDEVRASHVTASLTNSIQDVIDAISLGDTDKAVRLMHSGALEVESQLTGMSGDADIFQNWEDTYREVVRRVDRFEEKGLAGIPTGFDTLDERTGGPQPGHVWIVGARLGQGKTWSLVRMAVAAAFSGLTVQYDALEQSRAEIAMRVHTFASSKYGKEVFKNLDLAQGRNFDLREYKKFLKEFSTHKDIGKFHVSDTSRGLVSPMTIAAQIERNHPDAVFLDYITLMESEDGWESKAKLSAGLKQIAGQYQVPVIAAAQLNRAHGLGKEPPGAEALSQSDAIGQDADVVVTMKQQSKRVILMKLVKFRHGRDGYSWYTAFKPNTGHFQEITKDEALDMIQEDKDEEDDE
jgi:replicative DNA helicase